MGEARHVFTDPPIERAPDWFEERGRMNPFSPWIEAHIGARCYDFQAIVGEPADFARTPFYTRFAAPEGWDKGFSVMFWEGDSMRAMFSLYQAPGQPAFSEEEKAAVLALARHIEIAIIRVQTIDREGNFRSALQDFARTLPAPLLLLDWQPALVFANLAGYENAALWNFGPEKARRYNARECFVLPPALLEAVETCKERIAAQPPKTLGRRLPGPVVVLHPDNPDLRARVSPTLHGPSAITRPGFFVVFEAVRILSRPAALGARKLQRERALQMLTPAERKVVDYVCQGHRNAEIARALNKSVLTVKTQLNTVFQKLGLESRAQLISRLRG